MLNSRSKSLAVRRGRASGFSLIELMVTMAVFLVIAGAAFSLVTQHVPVFTSQQNQATLNYSLRNASAQVQIDTGNAGSGFYPSADVTSWPVGVTIVPGTGENCHQAGTNTYSAECFDTLNVIRADTRALPAQIGKDNPSDLNECNPSLANNASLPVVPVGDTTVDELASYYHSGDQILIISAKGGSDQFDENGEFIGRTNVMTTVKLTQDAKPAGGKLKLIHNATGDDGYNVGKPDNDDYEISTKKPDDGKLNKLGPGFCVGDWVVKLSPAVYRVDATDSSNPKLARLIPGDAVCYPKATQPYKPECIVAEQIIGFKIGAQIYDLGINKHPLTDCKPYCYDPSSYSYDWTQVRAIRVTLIGRTPPNTGQQAYYNTFDKGPYKIEAISLVVSPRSLTLQDEN